MAIYKKLELNCGGRKFVMTEDARCMSGCIPGGGEDCEVSLIASETVPSGENGADSFELYEVKSGTRSYYVLTYSTLTFNCPGGCAHIDADFVDTIGDDPAEVLAHSAKKRLEELIIAGGIDVEEDLNKLAELMRIYGGMANAVRSKLGENVER